MIGKITGNLEVYERYLHAKRYESRKDYSIETKDAEKIIKYIKSEMLKWENMKKEEKKEVKETDFGSAKTTRSA